MTDKNQEQDQVSKEITININSSQSVNSFECGEMFFQVELEEAVENISMLVNRNGINDDSRPCKPLTIFGDRGTGKSSFLNALKKRLREEKELKVCILETFEPNRIEMNEIFLVSVIVSIMKEAQKHNKDDDLPLQPLHETLDDLAKTFNVLIPAGELSERDRSESAIGFAERVLSDSDSGLVIYERFKKFVELACRVCNYNAFLVCIDDTDVAYNRCGNILETVRKYLDVNGLAVVIAAEEELLDIHLTKHTLEWISGLLDIEAHKMKALNKITPQMKRYWNQAHTLKEQYLNKTLPNHYRIYLTPLIYKIKDESYKINIKYKKNKDQSENNKGIELKEYIQSFTDLLGCSLKTNTDILPASNRSLMRMLKLLVKLQEPKKSRIQTEKKCKYDKDGLLEKFLDDLDGLFRPARHELNVHGWMLRELRQGKGDYALLQWIVRRAVTIPRSFNLTMDPNEQGDDRRIVPALVHASWGYGCRKKERIDVFLNYGICIVLPVYHLGWVLNRPQAVKQLEYHLDTIEHQGCFMTALRLLEWYNDYHQYENKQTGIEINKDDKLIPGYINDKNGKLKWYKQIENKDASFFLGLARVADICVLWQNGRIEQNGENKNENIISKYLEGLHEIYTDNWKKWLELNDMLYCLEDKYQVLPAHLIGEIFILLYNYWQEVLYVGEVEVKSYIYAFWYAILCWEMAWRKDEKWSDQLANLYRTIEADDITFLLDNNDQKVFLPHSIVWLLCPLFQPYFEEIKKKDYFLKMKIENAFANKKMEEYKKIVQELLGENLKGWS